MESKAAPVQLRGLDKAESVVAGGLEDDDVGGQVLVLAQQHLVAHCGREGPISGHTLSGGGGQVPCRCLLCAGVRAGQGAGSERKRQGSWGRALVVTSVKHCSPRPEPAATIFCSLRLFTSLSAR